MKNKWSNPIIEFLIIFIGISLAFLSENFREDYQDQQLAKRYLKSFYKDISYDKTDLENMLEINEKKLDRVNNFLTMIKNKETLLDSVNRIIEDMVEINYFVPKKITYESVKNSGNMEIISDYELKEKLVDYYIILDNKKLMENIYNTYLSAYIMPFLLSDFDLIEHKLLDIKVLNTIDFKNMVAGYRNILHQHIINNKFIFQVNNELLEKLEKYR